MLSIMRALRFRWSIKYYYAKEKADIVKMSKEIFDTKSTSEFFRLFANKREMFELDCMTHGMRRLTGLMKDSAFQSNFREYQDSILFLEHIGTISPATMTIKQLSGFVGLFHKFERRGINPSTHALKVKRKILQEIQNKVRVTEYKEAKDIDTLLVTYLQIQNESFNPPSLLIVQTIYQLLKLLSNNFTSAIPLTHYQLFTFVRAVSFKQEHSYIEKELIKIVLKKINQQIKTFEANLLMLIALDISVIDESNLTSDNMICFKAICDKLYTLVPDMSQKEVKMLLNYPSSLNNNGLTYLRTEIMRSLFSEIDEEGSSSVGSQQLCDLLIAGSTKLSLFQFSQSQQQNFFKFLLKFGPQKQKSRSGFLTLIISSLIGHNFFNLSHQPEIHKIIDSCQCKITIQILFRMATRGFQVGKLIKAEDYADFDYAKIKNLVKMNIVLTKACREKDPPEDIFKLKTVFDQFTFKQIDTPEKASQFYFKLSRQEDFSEMISHMHEAIPQLIRCLPNYFDANQQKSNKLSQKCLYFQYILHNFGNQSSQAEEFVQKYKDKIVDGVLKKMLQKQVCKSNEEIEVKKQLLLLIHCEFSHFITEKKYLMINLTASLLTKYLNSVIHGKLNYETEKMYWSAIDLMQKHEEQIKSFVKQRRNFDSLFYALISKSHYHKCKNNEGYTNFVKKIQNKKSKLFKRSKFHALKQENTFTAITVPSFSETTNKPQEISKSLNKKEKRSESSVRNSFFTPKTTSQ